MKILLPLAVVALIAIFSCQLMPKKKEKYMCPTCR